MGKWYLALGSIILILLIILVPTGILVPYGWYGLPIFGIWLAAAVLCILYGLKFNGLQISKAGKISIGLIIIFLPILIFYILPSILGMGIIGGLFATASISLFILPITTLIGLIVIIYGIFSSSHEDRNKRALENRKLELENEKLRLEIEKRKRTKRSTNEKINNK